MTVTVSRTPLRVSLLGGGTDQPEFVRRYGGAALSLAIDRYVYVAVADRAAHGIEIRSLERRAVDSLDELDLDLEREAVRAAGVTDGVQVTIASDGNFAGRGLGSSASVIVGLLNALTAHCGRQLDADALARLACHVELDLLARPVGIQDQYIAAFGGLRYYQFAPDGAVSAESLAVASEVARELDASLVLAYTGRSRDAGPLLADQRRLVDHNVETLTRLKLLAREGRAQLLAGSVAQLGELLDASWALKRTLSSGVSDAAIDALYRRALAAGALGGKVTGAGAGGYLLLLCPPDRQADLAAALDTGPLLTFGISPSGSEILSHSGDAGFDLDPHTEPRLALRRAVGDIRRQAVDRGDGQRVVRATQ